MAEIERMTDEQIKASIEDLKMAIRREKTDFTNAKKKVDDLQKRVTENNEKLKRNCQLPYMVANVGEILEPDEEDGEGEKAGSGFSAKKRDDKDAELMKRQEELRK